MNEQPPTPVDPIRDIVGFFLILFGSFFLFCAGIVAATLLTLFAAEPGGRLAEWWIIAVLMAFVGAAMVIGGRTLRALSTATSELATFADPARKAKSYPPYRHDDLQRSFAPVVADLRQYISFTGTERSR